MVWEGATVPLTTLSDKDGTGGSCGVSSREAPVPFRPTGGPLERRRFFADDVGAIAREGRASAGTDGGLEIGAAAGERPAAGEAGSGGGESHCGITPFGRGGGSSCFTGRVGAGTGATFATRGPPVAGRSFAGGEGGAPRFKAVFGRDGGGAGTRAGTSAAGDGARVGGDSTSGVDEPPTVGAGDATGTDAGTSEISGDGTGGGAGGVGSRRTDDGGGSPVGTTTGAEAGAGSGTGAGPGAGSATATGVGTGRSERSAPSCTWSTGCGGRLVGGTPVRNESTRASTR